MTLQRRPSHEGRGLKYAGGARVRECRSRPSHEGRGLKCRLNLQHHALPVAPRRPSHEGRGLKLRLLQQIELAVVAPHTRGVD